MKAWLRAYWPHLFGSAVAAVVGVPAAVASYLHGISVIERSGNPDTAAWLPMTTDGLLVASLVALWVRRLTGRQTGRWHWAAFGLGLVATTLTNVAGARPYIEKGTGWDVVEAVGWAVWPPICLAVVLEIVAWMVVPDVAVETGQTDEQAGMTDAGPAVNQPKLSDEEILPKLREWVQRDGKVPGRQAVIDEWGVGATRADRLRGLVTPGPRLVATAETDSVREA